MCLQDDFRHRKVLFLQFPFQAMKKMTAYLAEAADLDFSIQYQSNPAKGSLQHSN